MKNEREIRMAEIAKDLTIAIWGKNELLFALRQEGSIPKGAHPIADFEEVYAKVERMVDSTSEF